MPPFSCCHARERHVARTGQTGGYGIVAPGTRAHNPEKRSCVAPSCTKAFRQCRTVAADLPDASAHVALPPCSRLWMGNGTGVGARWATWGTGHLATGHDRSLRLSFTMLPRVPQALPSWTGGTRTAQHARVPMPSVVRRTPYTLCTGDRPHASSFSRCRTTRFPARPHL